MDIQALTNEIKDEMIQIRRHIHQHPELSMQEYQTTELIMDTLKNTSIALTKLPDDTGVIGVLRGGHDGRTLGLRADIDALPINEQTGLSFTSKREGIMHACGHDLHTTVLLGTALVLDRIKDTLSGNIKFIFQPGEEIMQGAKLIIEEGVLEKEPKVDEIICLHTWPLVDSGKIGVRKGPIMAAADTFEIIIEGSGGHAAHPHLSIDPIPVAGQIIGAFQTIISRRTSPLDSAVVTLGQIHGGNTNNTIAKNVTISGTIRSLSHELRKSIKKEIKEISENIGKAFNTGITVTFFPGSPPVINNDKLVDIMSEAVKENLGDNNLVYLREPSLGGEDFSFYLQERDGMLFRIGTRNENEASQRSLHNPGIIFDEDAISTGIIAMSSFALKYLNEYN